MATSVLFFKYFFLKWCLKYYKSTIRTILNVKIPCYYYLPCFFQQFGAQMPLSHNPILCGSDEGIIVLSKKKTDNILPFKLREGKKIDKIIISQQISLKRLIQNYFIEHLSLQDIEYIQNDLNKRLKN